MAKFEMIRATRVSLALVRHGLGTVRISRIGASDGNLDPVP